MAPRARFVSVPLCLLVTLAPFVTAQYGQPGYSGPDSYGGSSSSSFSGSGFSGGSSSSSSSSSTAGDPYNFTETAKFKKSGHIIIIHAVLGTLAWALLAPLGGIVLRLNIPGFNLVRYHMGIQLTVYAMTVATAGLGISLAMVASEYRPIWTNSHIIIGLIIFSAATIQPWLGWIHHVIFKRRLINFKKGIGAKKPGRTVLSIIHIWVGRSLILLGVINGGLGIRLAGTTPFQTASTTREALLAYGILAALMFLLYACVSIVFEYRSAARLRTRRSMQQVPFSYAELGQSPMQYTIHSNGR